MTLRYRSIPRGVKADHLCRRRSESDLLFGLESVGLEDVHNININHLVFLVEVVHSL
jgi:hypothetical protein